MSSGQEAQAKHQSDAGSYALSESPELRFLPWLLHPSPPPSPADAVVKMLNLNNPVSSSGFADGDVYKVLIIDRFCRDIISPLLKVIPM